MNGYEPRTSWRHVAAVLLFAATGCTSAGTGAIEGGVRSGLHLLARQPRTPIESPTPQDPVLSPRPGEVIELDQHGPEYVFTKAGRYAVRLTPELVYEVDAPDMWEVYRGGLRHQRLLRRNRRLLRRRPVAEAWLPAHPCRDRALVPVGPTARDLADALAGQPVLEVTRPKPVSITGGRGVYVEVRIPDRVDPGGASGGRVALFTWTRPPTTGGRCPGGESLIYWILDVDGQRLVLAGVCDATCSDADLEVLAGMAKSVTFTRHH